MGRNPNGVWWSGSSRRGIDASLPSKLPSAYSDRGYAFPLKIKGGTDRYFRRGVGVDVERIAGNASGE